jgi:hypothetical protein
VPLVVLDATLLATATAFAGSSYRAWPDVPPITSNPEADCVAVIAGAQRHGKDFGLVVSEALLRQVAATLRTAVGLRERDIDAYLVALLHFVRRSGGRIAADPSPRGALPSHLEVPLELARAHHAVVVAGHPELRDLGPEWSADRIPVLGAREFSVRADAARRARSG